MGKKVSIADLRAKSKDELIKELNTNRLELQQLRISQVTGGVQSKLAKIKVVRKTIARIRTIMTDNVKRSVAMEYKNKKYIPLDLRPKLTRSKRRALTKKELKLKTPKQKRKERNAMKYTFALKL